MKKLLYQFDTDPMPSVFDNVVAYDGGADQVTAYGGVDASNVGALVDGTIFTRAPKDKKFTAIFIGGGDMTAGEALLKAVRKKFFGGFRVSLMLDSNGSNTTAAAAIAWLAHSVPLAAKRAVVSTLIPDTSRADRTPPVIEKTSLPRACATDSC